MTTKKEFLETLKEYLKTKDKSDGLTKEVSSLRGQILESCEEEGIADRIDATGSRYWDLPWDSAKEFKVERRVRRVVDLEAAVELLEKREGGGKFVQITVTGDRSLLRFLKRQGFTDYRTAKMVSEGDIVEAVKAGVLSESDLKRLTLEDEQKVLRTIASTRFAEEDEE